jgi:hypothetical protein
MAAVTNLENGECRHSFTSQIASILTEQGESLENAVRLGESTARSLAAGSYGPRPFLVASPSGADYAFFIQRKKSNCLLCLYARQKGFVSYSNNLTYISTKDLAACQCAE